MQLLPQHWTLSLWCRKGEAFCVRLFVLYHQQPEKHKQNVNFAPPWKNFCGRPCLCV